MGRIPPSLVLIPFSRVDLEQHTQHTQKCTPQTIPRKFKSDLIARARDTSKSPDKGNIRQKYLFPWKHHDFRFRTHRTRNGIRRALRGTGYLERRGKRTVKPVGLYTTKITPSNKSVQFPYSSSLPWMPKSPQQCWHILYLRHIEGRGI